jgi:ABC-type molybdate transport system ATPase subunit
MKHSPKLAILQSLDAMDQLQMEEVMSYIKAVLNKPAQPIDYVSFKREAMKEIRQALRQEKKGLPLLA